jgi:hypothetical protein
MLKEDFTKRQKDENKATDGKDTGDKRMKNSPPAKKFKSWISVSNRSHVILRKNFFSVPITKFKGDKQVLM